jgi:HAD superfamily hydrolase (TIGR01509 family)
LGLRAVFFDAGGTLVFPDRERTLAPLKSRGLSVTEERIHAAERAARRFRDAVPPDSVWRDADKQYWKIYYGELLGSATDERLMDELVALSQTSRNWNLINAGTREILLSLKQRFSVALISNSDGRVSELMQDVGLGDCFESITDSGVVGYQKPSPKIFQAAIAAVGIEPNESVYIGDIYSIDYVGAKGVGMHAVLMDSFGTYAGNGVTRVGDLIELRELLMSGWPEQ